MRFIKNIFILIALAIVFSAETLDRCSFPFSNHREFIKIFFSDPKNIIKYEGQSGYIKFVEEHLRSLHMDTVHIYTSKVLSKKDMDALNWKKYYGSTKDFKEERSRILDKTGNIKKSIRVRKAIFVMRMHFTKEKC